MIISSGNFFRKSLNMTEDTTITGGNFILCQVTTNGFIFNIHGGNVRGLYIDGVKQDSYVWQRHEPLAIATTIIKDARKKGGDDGVEAWLYGFVEQVLNASPTLTLAQAETGYNAWQVTNNNFVTWSILRGFILSYMPGGWGWTDLRDFIRTHTLETWEGNNTQLVEEYS